LYMTGTPAVFENIRSSVHTIPSRLLGKNQRRVRTPPTFNVMVCHFRANYLSYLLRSRYCDTVGRWWARHREDFVAPVTSRDGRHITNCYRRPACGYGPLFARPNETYANHPDGLCRDLRV
jgi:hypothetical protein